jgi:hypothetical protein
VANLAVDASLRRALFDGFVAEVVSLIIFVVNMDYLARRSKTDGSLLAGLAGRGSHIVTIEGALTKDVITLTVDVDGSLRRTIFDDHFDVVSVEFE